MLNIVFISLRWHSIGLTCEEFKIIIIFIYLMKEIKINKNK
jgi:hypothetical protein